MNYGIRVKNPLPHPVKVEVIEGKTIIRRTVINPGQNVYIGLEKAAEYDIRTTILGRVVGAVDAELGPASFDVVDHQDVKEPEMKPISLHNTIDLKLKFWRDIVTWKVTPGSFGELLAVEIEQSDYVAWRLKVMKPGDGRFGGELTKLERTTTFFSSGDMVGGGEIIKLQAKSISGAKTSAKGRISGREAVVHQSLSPADVQTQPAWKYRTLAEEEDEEPVRTLADMLKVLEEQEVKI